MSYHYYIEHPAYRCSYCGRRCGPNGHAGCGSAELINGIPTLAIPFIVGGLWLGLSFVVGPVSLFLGWGGLWSGWWTLGKVLVGLSTLIAIISVVVGVRASAKHKRHTDARSTISNIVVDGALHHKTADVIAREIKNVKE